MSSVTRLLAGSLALATLPWQPPGTAFAAGASLPPPPAATVRPQICATRGKLPGTEANNGRFLTEDRALVTFGPYGCANPRLVVPAFYVNTAGLGEYPLQNSITWIAALEKLTPNNYALPGYFPQVFATALTVTPGDYFAWTDPIGVSFGPYEQAKAQVGQVTAGGTAYYLSATGTYGPSDQTYNSSSAQATQVPLAGVWASATPRFTSPNVGTTAIIGYPTKNSAAVCIFGDSIANSRDDENGDANGFHGYLERGLAAADPNGKALLFYNLAQSGEKILTYGAGNATARLGMAQYCSTIESNAGTNDLTEAGITLFAMQSRYLASWAQFRQYGRKVWQSLILPRTTSNVGITSLTAAGTTVTATVGDTSMLSTGEYVVVTGASPTTYNTPGATAYGAVGVNVGLPITVVDGTHFTYTVSAAPASSPATGTPQYSDGAASLANQQPIANFASGGLRDQVNAWIRTQVGVTIDGVIDATPYVESQTQHGKWTTTSGTGVGATQGAAVGVPFGITSDPGIHMTDYGHALAAQAVAAVAPNFP